MKKSKKDRLVEQIAELLATVTDEEIELVGASLQAIGSGEVRIGACSVDLRRALTRVRLMLARDDVEKETSDGFERISFEDAQIQTQFSYLAVHAERLIRKEFSEYAIIRKNWDVVEEIPNTLN